MSIPFSHFFQKINQISPLEANFTEVLSAIVLKPKMLYFYGKMPENVLKSAKSGGLGVGKNTAKVGQNGTEFAERPKSVAIVGSRHNTKYGEEVAYQLAYALAKRGVVVVSGMAYGIDGMAHRGCLDAGGVTVAVLGTAINDIYPVEHFGLAERILEQNGAIVSEYAPRSERFVKIDGQAAIKRLDEEYAHTPLAPGEAAYLGLKVNKAGEKVGRWLDPLSKEAREHPELMEQPLPLRKINQKLSFLYRNRLIAGLADITVVVEAAERSGSLNTAAHALDQGKEVFAVPGNINNFYSKGCNQLIAHGATPYTEPDDVLKLLFPEDYVKKPRKSAALRGSTPEETAVLQALGEGLSSGDDIIRRLQISPAEFNQLITLLEIKSRARALGANHWSLM